METQMVDDLYIPAARAQQVVDDIKAFLEGDVTDDEQWDQMVDCVLRIQTALVEVLKDNEQI